MAINAGDRLGPYEILTLIGAGGMGEVYRATDPRLGREVAIKVLPDVFARDPERLARFEREARVLASLNHPNIAAIYGFEQAEGVPFLVMELVPGANLKGPLPVDEALAVAAQTAAALQAAHEKGIIHRDLKPANIKITPEGKVKVLDFGLAKALGDAAAEGDPAHSPTMSVLATRAGVMLGTAAYMSPEQARGKPLDKRTDIWSFGCVLFEALTGRQPFTGETISHLFVALLERDPDWEALPPATPPRIRDLLRRCLQRDRDRRLHDIADARIEIEEAQAEPSRSAVAPGGVAAPASPTPRPPSKRPASLLAAGALAGALAAGLAVWFLKPAPIQAPRPPKKLIVPLPGSDNLGYAIALSPDGTKLVYLAWRGSARRLYLRSMDQMEAKPIPGTENAFGPFFSPDGQWLGFFVPGQLRKVSISGGAPLTICTLGQGRGASWGPDDNIIFGSNDQPTLMRVPASGGKPEPVTKVDPSKGESAHRYPQILPGGAAVLYAANAGGNEDRLVAQSLQTGQRQVLVESGTSPRYAGGYLTYVQSGTLMAAPLDLEQMRLTGTPTPVLETPVATGIPAAAHYSIAGDGTLAYLPGGGAETSSLVWVDRKGVSQPVPAAPAWFHDLRLSPDGRRLALNLTQAKTDLWLYDLQRDTLSKLTFEGENHGHAWHPDGKRIAYASTKAGGRNLFLKSADGTGQEEPLTAGHQNSGPTSWSPDGRYLAFNQTNAATRQDIMILPLEGDRKPQPFLNSPALEGGGIFSPGPAAPPWYVAYQSDETGRSEVYVQPFPGGGGKWQISTDGGVEPIWSRQGRELFYRNGDKVMAVEVQTKPAFSASKPKQLFEGRYRLCPGTFPYWDVSPDGQRFVMIKSNQESGPAHIHVVVDWLGSLRRAFAR